jgi:hypothetical protein
LAPSLAVHHEIVVPRQDLDPLPHRMAGQRVQDRRFQQMDRQPSLVQPRP